MSLDKGETPTILNEVIRAKNIVDKTFEYTKKAVAEFGWSGKLISQGGALNDLINPSRGEINNKYTETYPNQLISLVERMIEGGINVDAKWLSLVNLAYLYNRAKEEAGDDDSKFKGDLGKLGVNPYFQLALLLTGSLDQMRGKPWPHLLSTDYDNFKLIFYNGEGDKVNKSFPYFKKEELEKIKGLLPLDPNKQTFSIRDVLKLIAQYVK